MKVVKPITITTAMVLDSSGVSGDVAYLPYSAATTYAKGVQRKVDDDTNDIHMLYESLQDNNLGHDPWSTLGTWWAEVTPLPGWELFDESPSTLTEWDLGPWHGIRKISYTIAPGVLVDTLGLINLNQVLQVDVSVVTAAEGEIFATSINMQEEAGIVDFYTFLTSDIILHTDLAVNFPAAIGEITVTLWGAYDYGLSIGCLVLGKAINIGDTQWGVSLGITDYSVDEVDQWGHARLIQGAYARRQEADLELDSYLVDHVYRTLSDLRATPALWIGSELYGATIAYGRYEHFNVIVAGPAVSDCALTIKGLV